MNVLDIMKYGDITLVTAVEKIPKEHWEEGGACGWWSVKDIIAHMTMSEIFIEQILNNIISGEPIGMLALYAEHRDEANDIEVRKRSHLSADEVMAEYRAAHERTISLAAQIPAETFRQNGTMPWYGEAYCLDDAIVYMDYAHKREHGGHIDVFGDRLNDDSQ